MAAESRRPVIVWLRRDLRLDDNPALKVALSTGRPILTVYILDPIADGRPLGGASRWWLDKSLRALDAALTARGSKLILRRGDSEGQLRDLIATTGADAIYMNRRFEPDAFQMDADIAHSLGESGVECHGYNGSLLARPGSVLTGAEKPYRVFTPFHKALLRGDYPAEGALPDGPLLSAHAGVESDDVTQWMLHPQRPDWSTRFAGTPGEEGAKQALASFVADHLNGYSVARDVPNTAGTSRLSAHLHWGEISPKRMLQAARDAAASGVVPAAEADKFITEIGWREFSAHLLYQFPYMAERPFRPEFEHMPWRDDADALSAWQSGNTGYPLVDAGLRELWATGWMHNRVRMVVASFLVKHLMIDWRAGEAWFWDTLVDADLASNVQNWQWVAGSGADAAPYFRIFNPVIQGEKFDRDGHYVRRWVPEIASLPNRWLHSPWAAPADVLRQCKISLGHTYARPIVDHAEARARALDALKLVTDHNRENSDF